MLISVLEPQGRIAEAIPWIQRALRENPSSATHHQWLGKFAESSGEFGEAALHYMRASQAAPDQFEPLADLGRISLKTGRFVEATGIFRAAANEFPDRPLARFYLGLALEASGDPQAARTAYLEAEHGGAETTQLYMRLARLEAAEGRTDSARSYYHRVLELDPNQDEARRELEALTG